MNEVLQDEIVDGVQQVIIGAPEGAVLKRYAKLMAVEVGFVIDQTMESHLDPDGDDDTWVLCGDAGPGWTTVDKVLFTAPVIIEPVYTQCTKRAFQARFPKAANNISTKWDVMCLFLADDGYAGSLGVTGAPVYELRLLITTGQQRLNASPFVSMLPGGEAETFTQLLVSPSIPAAFRITAAERTKLLTDPLLPEERYKG